MATLPWEIIVEEILPKLPARSLVRFKCVSKSFKTIISSPNFIDLHLRQSCSSDANRLLIARIDGKGLHLIDLDSPENPPLPLPIPSSFIPSLIYPIVGICNGLLLISGRVEGENTSKSLLINPVTGLSTVVWGYLICNGFGFDAVIGHYKFVSFVGAHLIIKKLNDRQWENSATPFKVNLNDFQKLCCDGVVLNNHLCHWLLCSHLETKFRIMCFDLCSATWTQDVPLPDYVCFDPNLNSDLCRDNVRTLGIFDGCLMVSTINSHSAGFGVWVMKEYGVAGSWVKLFNIPDRQHAPITYARGSNSKILLCRGSKLIWYNIRNKQCEQAGIHDIHGVHGIGYVYETCLFKGSLVNVPRWGTVALQCYGQHGWL